MKKCYALLVGINDYFGNSLSQCIADVGKMESYCHTLKQDFDKVCLTVLLNEAATKEGIINALLDILVKIKDADSLIFYFSGHGAQEQNNGRFKEEIDDLLECLVCYYEKGQSSGFLLADKELRYLLSKCETKPHILTVFDCCHAGDMVRSNQQKRISAIFPSRHYKEFLFAEEVIEKKFQKQRFTQIFPFKNSVHIAACQSNQSAWEDSLGGVFTRYLLTLLAQIKNQLNYQFLVQWSKINIRDNTPERQIPTLSVQGEGNLGSRSNWLGIYDQTIADGLKIIHHNQKGWQLNMGKLLNLKEGMVVRIELDGGDVTQGQIEKVDFDFSAIKFDADSLKQLTTSKSYPVSLASHYEPLKIYINNTDENASVEKLVKELINKEEGINSTKIKESDFWLNIFNQEIYCSLPNSPFQPLNHQLGIGLPSTKVKANLQLELLCLKKWNHFNGLYNPNQLLSTSHIKMELKKEASEDWIDITDGDINLKAFEERNEEAWWTKYQVKVTNQSSKDMYVSVLTLGSDMSISAGPFDGQTVLLPAGKSKYFYDHLAQETNDQIGQGFAQCYFDLYKEVYNWEYEWFHYKLIVSEAGDFSASIPSFLQEGFYPPRMISNRMNVVSRFEFEQQEQFWQIYTSTIRLMNPNYNQISEVIQLHLKDDRISPYLKKVYPSNALKRSIT